MLVLAPVYQITYLASKRKEQLRKYGTTFLFKLKLSLISKNKPLASHAEKKKTENTDTLHLRGFVGLLAIPETKARNLN